MHNKYLLKLVFPQMLQQPLPPSNFNQTGNKWPKKAQSAEIKIKSG